MSLGHIGHQLEEKKRKAKRGNREEKGETLRFMLRASSSTDEGPGSAANSQPNEPREPSRTSLPASHHHTRARTQPSSRASGDPGAERAVPLGVTRGPQGNASSSGLSAASALAAQLPPLDCSPVLEQAVVGEKGAGLPDAGVGGPSGLRVSRVDHR